MNLYYISLLFFKNLLAREQYPWYLSDGVLLLKQGLKIDYLPISTGNGTLTKYIQYIYNIFIV